MKYSSLILINLSVNNTEVSYILTKKEYKQNDENHFWFSVGDILNFEEAVDVNDYLLEKDISEYGKEKFRYAGNLPIFNRSKQ